MQELLGTGVYFCKLEVSFPIQHAKEVFAEVIAQKIRDTKTKDKLAIMKDKQYNDYEFSNLKSA